MASYIDAVNAERPAHPESQYDIGYNNGLSMATAIAINMDVVAVVRCKNCKRLDLEDELPDVFRTEPMCFCTGYECYVPLDNHCGLGERRSDE